MLIERTAVPTYALILSRHMQEKLAQNELVCLESLDIRGAFDTASRDLLIEPLRGTGIDGYTARFVEMWLRQRTFRVRVISPKVRSRSKRIGMVPGLPPGGIMSPLLWLSLFNKVADRILSAFHEHA